MFKERQVIKEILQILYCEEDENGAIVLNEDKQWDGDTLPAIAECLRNHGYIPENGIHMKPNQQIAIVWDAEDVIDRAKDIYEGEDFEVTMEEAIDIVEKMKRRHDCCNGITWDTIDYYLDELKEEKKEDN